MSPDQLREEIDRRGYAVVPEAFPPGLMNALAVAIEGALAAEGGDGGGLRRRGGLFGIRDLLRQVPEVRQLAASPELRALVEPVLGPGAFVVRGLFFDKPPEANWAVAWHQDRTIAVRRRIEVPGFEVWSVKAGVPHVQAPVSVLERMLAVRIHLDPCGEENGPLRVLPGSHARGRLTPAEIREWSRSEPPVACVVPRGGAVLMRPLLLHSSQAALRPGHRRVIHLELAANPLPGGLEWDLG